MLIPPIQTEHVEHHTLAALGIYKRHHAIIAGKRGLIGCVSRLLK